MIINRDQFENSYRELEVPLYNFALRWVFNPALAEDIVQDAFIRIWRRRDEVRIETIKALLYKTVQNLAINEGRKRRVRDSFQLIANWMSGQGSTIHAGNSSGSGSGIFDGLAHIGHHASPRTIEHELIQREELEAMRKALELLPHNLREVLLLTQFSDFSQTQIAELLEIAEGTVASRRSRALSMLRNQLTAPPATLNESKEND